MAMAVYFSSSKIINTAESDIIETAKHIDNGVNRRKLPLWFITIYMIVNTVIVLKTSQDHIVLIMSIILSVTSLFDMIRNWIPDLLIFLLIALSFMGTSNSNYLITITCVIALTPFLTLNIISIISKKQAIIATGDLYVISALSLWLLPFTALMFSALVVFFASGFSLITKMKNIPLVPFIHFSFLLSHSMQYYLL